MRILFLESHPMFIHGLPNGFIDLGHTVLVSGEITEKNLPEMLDDFCPDLIFTLGWTPENGPKEKQQLIRKYVLPSGVPHVYWATEDPGYTMKFSLPLIKAIKPNFVFTICPEKVDFYEKLGIPSWILDFGFHSSIHNLQNDKQYAGQFALVANAYHELYVKNKDLFRFKSVYTLVNPLLSRGFLIDFYGKEWEKMKGFFTKDIPRKCRHGYLPYLDANKVYSSVDVVIGPQNIPTQLTQRTYEVLGSSGFLITSDTPAVRKHFTPGRDLIVSSSESETWELISYYLNNPGKREIIRKQGQRTVQKHSYKYRAQYILDVLQRRCILNKDID